MTTHVKRLREALHILRVAQDAEGIMEYVPDWHCDDEGALSPSSIYADIEPTIEAFVKEARALASRWINPSDIQNLIDLHEKQ